MESATNPAGSPPRLPYDVFHEILEHLEDDKSTLCAVSLSSTFLRQEAQNIIFRDVTTLPSESRHTKFLLTVATSPSRLALLVRGYRIERMNISRELSARIHEGLLAMTNLKHLGVYYVGWTEMKSPNGPAAVLRGCTFKLERFQWLSNVSEAPELLETFLPQQNGIRHISLEFNRAAIALQSIRNAMSLQITRPAGSTISLCPQLISLVADWDLIKILLPGHKITALTVLDSYIRPSTNIDVNSLAPALKNIKTLSYKFLFEHDEVPPPERVLSYCSSLEVLELRSFNEKKILVLLPKLPSLNTIVLSGYLLSDPPLQQGQAKELVRRLFDNSSRNLQIIDLQVEEIYERSIRPGRDEAAVSRVSRSEVRALFPE